MYQFLLLSLLILTVSNTTSAQHHHISGNGYADSVNKGLIAKDPELSQSI